MKTPDSEKPFWAKTDMSDELLQANTLLAQTLAYLERLPGIPATVEMARKIKSHLDDPQQAQATRVAQYLDQQNKVRHALVSNPSGIVLFQVRLERDQLSIHTPPLAGQFPPSMRNERDSAILFRLQNTEVITLKDATPKA